MTRSDMIWCCPIFLFFLSEWAQIVVRQYCFGIAKSPARYLLPSSSTSPAAGGLRPRPRRSCGPHRCFVWPSHPGRRNPHCPQSPGRTETCCHRWPAARSAGSVEDWTPLYNHKGVQEDRSRSTKMMQQDERLAMKRDNVWDVSSVVSFFIHSPSFGIPSVSKMIMSKLLSGSLLFFLSVDSMLMAFIMASLMLVTETSAYSH